MAPTARARTRSRWTLEPLTGSPPCPYASPYRRSAPSVRRPRFQPPKAWSARSPRVWPLCLSLSLNPFAFCKTICKIKLVLQHKGACGISTRTPASRTTGTARCANTRAARRPRRRPGSSRGTWFRSRCAQSRTFSHKVARFRCRARLLLRPPLTPARCGGAGLRGRGVVPDQRCPPPPYRSPYASPYRTGRGTRARPSLGSGGAAGRRGG